MLSVSGPRVKPVTSGGRTGERQGLAFHSVALPEVADGDCILSVLHNRYIILPADRLGTNDLPMTYTHARTEPFLL